MADELNTNEPVVDGAVANVVPALTYLCDHELPQLLEK